MNAIGRVTKIDGKRAVVVSQRSSACASCHNCESKGKCHAELIFGNQSEDVLVFAENDVDAKIGDKVVLEGSTAKTLGIMFFIFVFPIVLTGLLYFFLINFIYVETSFLPVILLLSFAVFFVVSSFVANSYMKKHSKVHIVRVLEEC